jgi:hypothetical protein
MSKLSLTFAVLKRSSKIWATSVIYKDLHTQSKQSQFAQSGHSVANVLAHLAEILPLFANT